MTLYHRDRNWLEFLSVLDATFCGDKNDEHSAPAEVSRTAGLERVAVAKKFFAQIAEEDGARDRSALLASLELEKRARDHGLSSGLLHSIAIMFKH